MPRRVDGKTIPPPAYRRPVLGGNYNDSDEASIWNRIINSRSYWLHGEMETVQLSMSFFL